MDKDVIKLILELGIAFFGGFASGTFYIKKKYNLNNQKNVSNFFGNSNYIKQENNNEKGKRK